MTIEESKKALNALGGQLLDLASVDWKKVARELSELSPEERNEILIKAATSVLKLLANFAEYRGMVMFLIRLMIK